MTDEFGTAAKAQDKSRIRQASEAVRDIADDLKPAVKGMEPAARRITDEIGDMARRAPLQTLAIAFLLGLMIGRRR